ncbi:sugar ABC transporter ATP-binding protein [Brevibacillus sp. B_LB10_24]|uniref:sugar ABC transporter ATP-binding protein n=1 Tax=Brevibacillus sp. B_LB10_24 TaxID=3380645 RepID=UPI0038B7B5D5
MENICKSFPGVQALDHVSFTLKKGEVHCLLGENGAGKSTLIKILSGAQKKDDGEIYLQDEEVEIHNALDSRRLGISTIYQEMNLIPAMTVAENVFFGEELTRSLPIVDFPLMEKQTREILQKMKVQIDPGSLVKNLSTAQQQMVEIARSLIKKRQIIIMDEPTSSISEKDAAELFRIIKELKREGVAIIYISHRLHEFKEIVDRVTILRDGQYVDTVRMEDVTTEELINKMVGRKIDRQRGTANRTVEETVLRVEALTYRQLVKNVSFELKRGEIIGFAGLVGSGRTELMKTIFGAYRPDDGSLFLNGKPIRIGSPKDAVRHGIGYLSEDRKREGLVLESGIEKNITLANLKAVSKAFLLHLAKEKEVAVQQMKTLQIAASSYDKKVKLLSGGNQQKVVIAKWLLTDCNILIFDEPTRGIDVGAREEIYQLIENLASSGKSIIVVSSDLPEVLRVSNRIIVMNEGRITGEFINDGRLTQEQIMSVMVGG